MAVVALISCGVTVVLVALAALLTLGLGPVVALMVFWLGGLAATLALAIDFARSTTLAAVSEDASAHPKQSDGA